MVRMSMSINNINNIKLRLLHCGEDPIFLSAWIQYRTLFGGLATDDITTNTHRPEAHLF
jgi:hypothetical protein